MDDKPILWVASAKFAEGIYVLHVFQKKSQKTSGLDLEVARTRYTAVRRSRRED